MNISWKDTRPYIGLIAVATVLGVLSVMRIAPIAPAGALAYLLLAIVPGGALYMLIAPRSRHIEWGMASLAMSPVLVTAASSLIMIAGASAQTSALIIVVGTGILGIAALWLRGSQSTSDDESCGLDGKQTMILLGSIIVLCLFVIYLPATRELWRTRSDAWFHGSVVAQISDFGLLPEDPYIIGFSLQYMWLYHVLVVTLSKASAIGPFMVMALVNIQALAVFMLAAFLFSSLFKRSFLHDYTAMLTAVFGMNAVYWIFIPFLVAVAAFSGDVRGWAEVTRSLSLIPFDIQTVRRFIHVGYNQEFFLDKFMVGTAFSLGVCLLAVSTYACAAYLKEKRSYMLAIVSLAVIGLVGFHTALGTLAFGAVFGGLVLLFVIQRYVDDFSPRHLVILAAVLAGSVALLIPYLYLITHGKSGGTSALLGLSLNKMVGILVSCTLVIILSAFQIKRFIGQRDPASRFTIAVTIASLGVCTLVALPGANTYDKLPFLIFLPLAVVGGWTLADFALRASTQGARIRRLVLASIVLFAPLNVLAYAAYCNSPPQIRLDNNEKALAAWVRANTPREAVFFDTEDRVFLLVAGPRRYYLGHEIYAKGWGYDPAEIDRRAHVRDTIYSPNPLDVPTLEALGSMQGPVFIVLRKELGQPVFTKIGRLNTVFVHRFSDGPIHLYEINQRNCRTLIEQQTAPGETGQ